VGDGFHSDLPESRHDLGYTSTHTEEWIDAKGGIRSANVFRMELEDPVRKRKLAHEYRITVLPVEG